MTEDDEIVDLVDANDTVVGTTRRGEAIRLDANGGRYIRFASVLIMNSDGDVWFPVRSLQKTIAPGGYDNSAEGHVEASETYEECALRELREETGIEVESNQLQLLTHVKFPGLPYYCSYFLLRTDQQPRLSDEHTSGRWLSPAQAREVVASTGNSAKETVLYAVALLERFKRSEIAKEK